MRDIKSIILVLFLFKICLEINIRGKVFEPKIMSSTDLDIEIWTLNSKYESVLKYPSGKDKYYQIEAGKSGKYQKTQGSSVYVNDYGTITPSNTTYYWYGGYGYSWPQEGKNPDRVETRFYPGVSVITATVGNNTFTITVTVKEYSEEYVENIINDYIKSNVTNKDTLEQFRAITAFPARYPYNASYQEYVDMVIFGGADCWGSSHLIQHLCEKVGIKSHVRFAARDPLAGSGHRNVAALINGKIYIGEAGYGEYTPNRKWTVMEKNIGYFYRPRENSKNEIIIYQYDGFDEEINVPSIIDNKTVVGFMYDCFSIGESFSKKQIHKITLPKTTISIDEYTFTSLKYLKEINIPFNVSSKINATYFKGCDSLVSINIDKDNSEYSSIKGVLFNKNQTKLIIYPANKNGELNSPSSLERIEEYAFNGTKQLEIVKLKNKVKYIGAYAFVNSTIKEIYFFGEMPEFGANALLNLNATFYYPSNSKIWNQTIFKSYGAKEIRLIPWTPKEENESFFEKHKTLLFITIGAVIVLIIVIILIIIIIKKCCKSSREEYLDSLEGGLTN